MMMIMIMIAAPGGGRGRADSPVEHRDAQAGTRLRVTGKYLKPPGRGDPVPGNLNPQAEFRQLPGRVNAAGRRQRTRT